MQNSVCDSSSSSNAISSDVAPSDDLKQLIKDAIKEVLADIGAQSAVVPSTPPTLNEKEAASILGVKPQTLAVWRTKGIGPQYIKVGRLVRYRPEDVQEYREQRLVRTSK